MKIKTVYMDIEEVLAQPVQQHVYPKRPNIFFRMLLRAVSAPDLKATNFKYREFEMEKLGKKEPSLVLMNHSSFIDLKIASTVLYPRPLNIVCTSDGFVGKERLMRSRLHTYPQVRNGYPAGTGYDVCTEKAEKLHTYVSRGKLYI